MRFFIFTLLLSFLSFGSLKAQEQVWNISSDEFNSLGDITQTTVIDGLTIYATDAKKVTVQDNEKEIDGLVFTSRLKLNGSGSIEAGAVYRVVSFDVTGNTTISIAAISGNGDEIRDLAVVAGDEELQVLSLAGDAISMNVVEYVGDATSIKIYSKDSGINLYYIKAVTEEAEEEPVVSDDALAILDPKVLDTTTLPSGMSVVEMDGTSYLQIVVDGYNSVIDVPEFTLGTDQQLMCNFKFSIGDTSAAVPFTLDQIKGIVQIMDTINKVDNPWGEGLVPSTTALAQDPVTGSLAALSGSISSDMSLVHQVQFYGQDKVNWQATIGDTIWVSKIRAITVDPDAIFDPKACDPDNLPAGMEIVNMDGTSYLQIVVDGYNSVIDVPEFTLGTDQQMMCNFKFSIGDTSAAVPFTLDQIKGIVQIMDTINKVDNPWGEGLVPSSTALAQDPVTGSFAALSGSISSDMSLVHQVQFYGQDKVNWQATKGDTIWVSKIRAINVDPDAIFDPKAYDPDNLPAGMEIVDMDGTSYLQIVVDGYNSVIEVPEFTIGTDQQMICDFKFSIGDTSAAVPFTLDQIKGIVQIMDTINKVDNPWGEGLVPSSTAIAQDPVNGSFVELSGAISTDMKLVHQVQFYGQDKVNWQATTGDTIWVSKIKAITVDPIDPNIVLDPATFDGTLETGWEIVDLDGTKYFKVAIDGWNTWINVPEYDFPAGKNAFKASVKYEIGTSGVAIEDISTFLKFSDASWAEIGSGKSAATTEFSDYVVTLAANEGNTAGVFQVAGQTISEGTALSGDFLYIGKVMAVTTAPISFVIDDSKHKKSEDGFIIKGSWFTNNGIYDSDWNGGALHAEFQDSSAINDVIGDNIWAYTINLVADENTWEWGFVDMAENWMVTGDNPQFGVADWTPQTLTYTIGGTSIDEVSAELSVYPNPVENVLNIKGLNVQLVEVFNMTGSKVSVNKLSNNQIDVSNLSNGSYILRATADNGKTSISKFSKK